MNHKHLKIAIGAACALLAVVLLFRAGRGGNSSGVEEASASSIHASDPARGSKAGAGKGVRESSRNPVAAFPEIKPRSLDLPVLPVDEQRLEEAANDISVSAGPRKPRSDDDILAVGGVVPVLANSAPKLGNSAGGTRSIKSDDWKGAANLLVNALRAGDRFEVNHDQLMDFLRGKDLLGWPEGYRNWIGDELMTALRQDMPVMAFDSLKSIEADTTAPAAMRDYSVQHISHLVTGGVIGKEGADFIWQTLEENDPQTLSTALISLYRLSEQKPDLVDARKVKEAAGRLRENSDERTRITAQSILKK